MRRDDRIREKRSHRQQDKGQCGAGIRDSARGVLRRKPSGDRAGYRADPRGRGYVLNERSAVSRTFKVRHTDDQLEEELYSIVDLGGCVRNVMVNHKVYGHMEAPLNITSRRKAAEFIEDIRRGKSSPLKNITSDYHYHLVEADSEETLDLIADMLEAKGFLIKKDQA